MPIELLISLGFTPTLARVYLSLLALGKAKAGEVIKNTKLPRSAVYASLEELVHRDLVSETQVGGVACFRANSPDNLVVEIERSKKHAKEVVAQLKQLQDVPAREVAVYEGVEGIKRAADKALDAPQGETVYFLGPSKFGEQADLERYWIQFHRQRIKKGLHSKILYDQSTDQKIVDERNRLLDSEARYLPVGVELPIWFTICADKLSIIIPGEDPTLVFSIRSMAAADGMKKYFEYFWNQK